MGEIIRSVNGENNNNEYLILLKCFNFYSRSGATPSKCSTSSSPSSSPSSPADSNPEKEPQPEVEEEVKEVKMQRPNSVRINGTSGIILTSVIHTGIRPSGLDESKIAHSQSVHHSLQHQHQHHQQQQQQQTSVDGKLSLPTPTYMSRSVTCSTLQTDI